MNFYLVLNPYIYFTKTFILSEGFLVCTDHSIDLSLTV